MDNLIKNAVLHTFSLFICFCTAILLNLSHSQSTNINISASKTHICLGESVELTASGGQGLGWEWNDNAKSKTDRITVTPTKDTTFSVKTKVRINNNIVVNGDFEQGNVGFTSDYQYVPTGNISPPGGYGIRNDANTGNGNWAHCNDHGYMLVADAAALGYRNDMVPPGSNVWCQEISVHPGEEYVFSAWLAGIVPPSSLLSFTINGKTLDDPHFTMYDIWESPKDTCNWREFFTFWKNTSNVTTITICLQESTGVMNNNDFVLDDVAFYQIVSIEKEISIKVDSVKFEAITTDVTCKGNNDGSIFVPTPISGVAPFTYQLNTDSPQNEHQFNNLPPSKYTITVKDKIGCSENTTAIIKEVTQPLSAGVISTEYLSCFGDVVGDVKTTLQIKGGKPNYTIIWNNTTIPTNTIEHLNYGDHIVYVKDEANCNIKVEFTLPPPSEIVIVDEKIEHIKCFGENTGLIEVSVSGGVPDPNIDKGYKYVWRNSLNEVIGTSDNINQLYAGIYSITVSDSAGYCSSTKNIEITQPLKLIANEITELTKNVSCYGLSDGKVILNVKGGTLPYSYTWNHDASIKDSIIENLSAGIIYNAIISDANECTTNVSAISVTQPTKLIATVNNVSNVKCINENNGNATVTVSGGTQPYIYLWNDANAQTTPTLTNVSAGKYEVLVSDNNNCQNVATAEIYEPSPIIIDIEEQTNVMCFGENNGSAKITVSGGNGQPYSNLWNNGQIGKNLKNVTAGVYTVVTTDSKGCVETKNITIEQPNHPVLATIVESATQSVKCYGESSGEASVIASGGLSPYFYSWKNTNGNIVSTTETATNLRAGIYDVTIHDIKNCSATTSITITEANPLLVNLNTEKTTICSGDLATIYATAQGGVAPFNINWGNNLNSWNVSIRISQDTVLQATITDALGCQTTEQIKLTTSKLPKVAFNASPQTTCFGNTVSLLNESVGDYTSCEWYFSDGTVIKNCGTINYKPETIGSIDVTLKITNFAGCTAIHTVKDLIYTVPKPIADFHFDKDEYDILYTEVNFTNTSKNATDYLWDFGDMSINVTQKDPTHIYPYAQSGKYTITLIATNKSSFCADTAISQIVIHEKELFFIPNTFTPNEDGYNELFVPIISAGISPEVFIFSIYDRWGELVFETNELHHGWDGKYKGKLQQNGVYTWKIQFQMKEKIDRKVYLGHVSLLH